MKIKSRSRPILELFLICICGEAVGVYSCEGVRQEPCRGLSVQLSRSESNRPLGHSANAPTSRLEACGGKCLRMGTELWASESRANLRSMSWWSSSASILTRTVGGNVLSSRGSPGLRRSIRRLSSSTLFEQVSSDSLMEQGFEAFFSLSESFFS